MKCEDVSNSLITYLDGRASAAECLDVEGHLAGCAGCQKRADEFRSVRSMLDELPAVEPSFGFDARVRQRVAAEPSPKWFGWFVPQARFALAAALLVALTVWIAKMPSRHPAANPAAEATQQEDFDAIKDLGVLENYDELTKFDALSELPATTEPAPAKTPQSPATAND